MLASIAWVTFQSSLLLTDQRILEATDKSFRNIAVDALLRTDGSGQTTSWTSMHSNTEAFCTYRHGVLSSLSHLCCCQGSQ